MFNVAIDGPAGAGKSSIAKQVAKELSFIYVDTGAMYRAIGLYFLEHQIPLDDEKACASHLSEIDVTISHADGVQQVLLNGADVSEKIRTPEVSDAASKTSAYPEVRAKLLTLQQKLAKENNVLMDGRDIGTVVLPNADLKIFLTASSKERARRRFLELREKGMECNIDEIQKEIEERDARDMNRAVAPLKQAEDAILLDSSDLTQQETAAAVIDLIEKVRQGK